MNLAELVARLDKLDDRLTLLEEAQRANQQGMLAYQRATTHRLEVAEGRIKLLVNSIMEMKP